MPSYEKIIKILKTQDWYHQSGAAKWLYISFPWEAAHKMRAFGKKIPVRYEGHAYLRDDFMHTYLSKESLIRIAEYYLGRQKADHGFTGRLYDNWLGTGIKPVLIFDRRIREIGLETLSDKQLVKLFLDFSKAYVAQWQEVMFLDGYDYHGEALIDHLVSKEEVRLSSEELFTLLTPTKPSFLQQERLAILRLAEKILILSKNKNIVIKSSYEDAIIKIPSLRIALKSISDKFYWLHNDYATVEYLGPEYSYIKLVELLSDSKKLKAEQVMEIDLRRIKSRKKEIIKRHGLSKDFVSITDYFAILGNFRDARKSYNQLSDYTVNILAKEFSRRSGVALDELEQLLYWEMAGLLANKKIAATARKRKLGSFQFIVDDHKNHEFYGSRGARLKSIMERSDVLMAGMPAYNGKVTAKARIIKGKVDFHKLKQGEVLVAPNTRPEYVPMMKIAGAIVTEEGGITSHAAIVSRELKVPCVVGVQGITSSLKDGDRVEVDAFKGVIRVLN